MIPRFLASRGVLFFYMAQTFAMTLVVGSEYVLRLLSNPLGITVRSMFDDSETIGVLLIATGVPLECREILLRRALRERHEDGHSLELSDLEHDLEYYGVVLLIIGLTIELIVAISNHLDGHVGTSGWYMSIVTEFHVFTMVNLSLLMIASMIAMIRVVILMYLPRRSS